MDRHTFADEYQKLYRRLWLIAAGITGNRTDADDIVQETAIVAFSRLDQFQPGSSLLAWLSEIARKSALNHRRKTDRRKTYCTDPSELEQQHGPEASRDRPLAGGLTVIAQDLDDDLFNVMAQMPEEVRCCILLRVIDGLSYAEISETLGIPEGTASSHVHRGKSFMRSRLSRSHNVGKQL